MRRGKQSKGNKYKHTSRRARARIREQHDALLAALDELLQRRLRAVLGLDLAAETDEADHVAGGNLGGLRGRGGGAIGLRRGCLLNFGGGARYGNLFLGRGRGERRAGGFALAELGGHDGMDGGCDGEPWGFSGMGVCG